MDSKYAMSFFLFFFFSSRRRHTRYWRDWSSDLFSSDLTRDPYMARVVGIESVIPKEKPAYTVNRLCGTGVQAIVSAAQAIAAGDAEVALAGGAESMSRGPYWMPDARWGSKMGPARMLDPVQGSLKDPFHDILLGVTAENLADRK